MFSQAGKKYKVLVLGAGFVSKPVLEYLTRKNDTAVTLGQCDTSLPPVNIASFLIVFAASDQITELDELMDDHNNDIDPVLLNVVDEPERLDSLVKGHDIVIR